MSWTEPITDRTADDITNRTAKAFLNVVDWIRINGNARLVNTLVTVLRGLNIEFTELSQPVITTFPSTDDINAFIENIDRLREAAYMPAASGLVALKHDYRAGMSGDSPDYQAVNDWEKDLELLRSLIVTSSDYMIYCGVAAPGQPRFWQVRWRINPNWVQPAASPVRRARSGAAACGTGLMRQNQFRRYA